MQLSPAVVLEEVGCREVEIDNIGYGPGAFVATVGNGEKIYVGYANNIHNAISGFKSQLSSGNVCNRPLQSLFNKNPNTLIISATDTNSLDEAINVKQRVLDAHYLSKRTFNVGPYAEHPRLGMCAAEIESTEDIVQIGLKTEDNVSLGLELPIQPYVSRSLCWPFAKSTIVSAPMVDLSVTTELKSESPITVVPRTIQWPFNKGENKMTKNQPYQQQPQQIPYGAPGWFRIGQNFPVNNTNPNTLNALLKLSSESTDVVVFPTQGVYIDKINHVVYNFPNLISFCGAIIDMEDVAKIKSTAKPTALRSDAIIAFNDEQNLNAQGYSVFQTETAPTAVSSIETKVLARHSELLAVVKAKDALLTSLTTEYAAMAKDDGMLANYSNVITDLRNKVAAWIKSPEGIELAALEKLIK
jgi:hypothetical protein